MFCRDYTAMKVHYYLIQIAHAISQLWEHSVDMKGLRYTIKELHDELKTIFRTTILSDEDIAYASMRKRIVLDHGLAA
jgi:myosin-crossreactive antigen